MRVIFTLPAATIYDAQHRVMGHRHTPCSRDALKQLKPLVPRLQELGVKRIICSDLDAQTGFYLARNLRVPCEEWQSLRRFNWGKLHGLAETKAADIKAKVAGEVPVRGGDSDISFSKRMAHSRARLNGTRDYVLVIAPEEAIAAILSKPVKGLERHHLYEVELGEQAKAVQ